MVAELFLPTSVPSLSVYTILTVFSARIRTTLITSWRFVDVGVSCSKTMTRQTKVRRLLGEPMSTCGRQQEMVCTRAAHHGVHL